MSKKQNAAQRNNRRAKRNLKRKQQFSLRRNTEGNDWVEVERVKAEIWLDSI